MSAVKRNVFINSIPPYIIGRDEMRELIPIRSAYTLLIIIAIIGIINAFAVFISYLIALKKPGTRYVLMSVLKVFFAFTSVVWFVLFASLFFTVAYNKMIIVVISWLFCEAIASAFLVLFVDVDDESEK